MKKTAFVLAALLAVSANAMAAEEAGGAAGAGASGAAAGVAGTTIAIGAAAALVWDERLRRNNEAKTDFSGY